MQCSVPPDNSALSHLWVHAGQWQYHMSNDATYPVLLPIFLSALSERYRQLPACRMNAYFVLIPIPLSPARFHLTFIVLVTTLLPGISG